MILYFTAFSVFLVVIVLASRTKASQRLRSRHFYEELANKWGLEVDGNPKTTRFFRASGRYKNYYVMLLERGTGINFFPCIKVICHNPLRKNFYICPEQSLSRSGWYIFVAKHLRIIRDTEIGDTEFDDFFYVHGKGTIFFQEILIPSIKTSLLNIFKRAAKAASSFDYSINLTFERNEFQYIEGGKPIMDAEMKQRFEDMLETIIDLAVRVDRLHEV